MEKKKEKENKRKVLERAKIRNVKRWDYMAAVERWERDPWLRNGLSFPSQRHHFFLLQIQLSTSPFLSSLQFLSLPFLLLQQILLHFHSQLQQGNSYSYRLYTNRTITLIAYMMLRKELEVARVFY